MGLFNVIRTLRLRHGLAIREISRRTGLSRNTIKKHLKAGTVESQFATPERQSKLDPFAEKLAGWLKAEAGKSRKQRRTIKQLHADRVALGFTGSYARAVNRLTKLTPYRRPNLPPCAVSRSGPEPTELITEWRRVRP